MKKMRFLVCLAAMTMVLSLGACGQDNGADANNQTEESGSENAAETQDNEKDSDSDKYASIEEYISSDAVQAELATLKESVAGQGLSMDITADGNKLIYTYTYTDVEKTDDMVTALKEGMVAQEASFTALADALKLEVDVENPVVVIEYLDANGEEIYSQEYTAE